tara:strand:- start:5914 stop:6594 length:681 start_codon:yes stop_codon:yes gene_type:complete
VPKKALFIGFDNCEQSKKAYEFLNICDFDTTGVFVENRRGSRLPISVKEWSGDYLFHFRSYCILKKRLLERVRIAAINFHPCPPQYPGAGGINWGLYNNDEWSGITVHHMNEKVDNGNILKIYKVPIFKKDTVESLLQRVHSKQLEAFYDFVGNISTQGQQYIEDMCDNISWAPRVGKIKDIDALELIDKNIDKQSLERIIRATHIGPYGPKLMLHGYEFRYRKQK